MQAAGKMDPAVYGAAEKFRMDFERAQLSGSYARTDLFRTRAGKGEITDKVEGSGISWTSRTCLPPRRRQRKKVPSG
jgi:hypothetical protein